MAGLGKHNWVGLFEVRPDGKVRAPSRRDRVPADLSQQPFLGDLELVAPCTGWFRIGCQTANGARGIHKQVLRLCKGDVVTVSGLQVNL